MNRRSLRSRQVSIAIGMTTSTATKSAIAPARQRHATRDGRSSQRPVSCHWRSFQPNTKNGSIPRVRERASVASIVSV